MCKMGTIPIVSTCQMESGNPRVLQILLETQRVNVNHQARDVSSYVTYVRGTSVGLLGKFSDVDVRTANRLPGYLV